MLTLELLPAAHGDSLWIEYGAKSDRHRIVIDGGPAHTYKNGLRKRIQLLPEKQRRFDLMVVTHIDADHIDGPVILLRERAALQLSIDEFWFNAWQHLPEDQATFAPEQGEFLSALLAVDDTVKKRWNKNFSEDGKKAAVMVDEDQQQPLPVFECGDVKLTLLGPGLPELRRLRTRWDKAMGDLAGNEQEALKRLEQRREYRPPSTPGAFGARSYGADRTPANGSSITLILEYGKRRILLAADAHAGRLATSLRRFAAQRKETKLRFDAVKLPHHGSMGNVDAGWLEQIECKNWLFSTNGAVFDHPDVETGDLIAKHSKDPEFHCNYLAPSTKRLADAGRGRWKTIFPDKKSGNEGPAGGLKLEFSEK